MLEYVGICVNMPKSAWIAFVLHSTCGCLFQWSFYSEEHKAVFLKKQNLIFSVVAGSIWFAFYSRLNIFVRKVSKLALPLGEQGGKGHGFWYT